MFSRVKRITIFSGHFGSGKTELAINYALKLAKIKEKVAVVDLDIVNPYFRSREVKDILEAKGVRVISPMGSLHHADLPAISPEVLGVLKNQEYSIVLDVGGDDVGATALGRFKANLPEGSYEMFFVVNSYRPLTENIEGVKRILFEVEEASRLKTTALVSNGNLSYETDKDIVIDGYRVTQAVADVLGLPIAFVAVGEGIYEEILNHSDIFLKAQFLKLELFMLPPWFQQGLQ